MDFSFILSWLGLEFGEPRTWTQAITVLVIIVAVWLINRYVHNKIEAQLDEQTRQLKRISLKAFERLFPPLTALVTYRCGYAANCIECE